MAKKGSSQRSVIVENILKKDISKELEQSYLSYAMSVIVGRAIPDVRDGLKPVQRRILYGMYEAGNTHSKPFVKCARIVGNVMGNYHPHGDSSIYDALVRMAQPFSMLVPLVDPQGNFGSIDGDNPAAMRYTEARLAAVTDMITEDIIGKNVTVPFVDNFDGSLKEPAFLPSRIPNLLVNGTTGIAVGMSTNILPHNLTEVMNAVVEAINVGDNFRYEDVAKHIKGPDFPTGGIVAGEEGVKKYLKTGQGRVIIRAKYHIENEKNRQAIIIDEIPYTVNKANLIEKIADLASAGKVVGISELRDESDKNGLRIYIGLKKDVNPDFIISYLYKNTQLEVTKNVQNLALTNNGLKPEILNIRDFIQHFIQTREEIIYKRTEHFLKEKEKDKEIITAELLVSKDPDGVIQVIRKSANREEALKNLMEYLDINEFKATVIYNKRIGTLNKFDINKLEEDLKKIEQEIKRLKQILKDRTERLSIIKTESLEIIQKFGEPRKSIIDFSDSHIDHDELVEQMQQADSQILISESWRVKRFDLEDYIEKVVKDETNPDLTSLFDEPIRINKEITSEHVILIFTKKGTVFSTTPSTIPLHTNVRVKKDTNMQEYIKIDETDQISDILILEKEIFDEDEKTRTAPTYFVFITNSGLIKKTDILDFKNIRSNGLKAINIKDGDSLLYINICDDGNQITIKTKGEETATVDLETLKVSSRTARGQAALKMADDDVIAEIEVKGTLKMLELKPAPKKESKPQEKPAPKKESEPQEKPALKKEVGKEEVDKPAPKKESEEDEKEEVKKPATKAGVQEIAAPVPQTEKQRQFLESLKIGTPQKPASAETSKTSEKKEQVLLLKGDGEPKQKPPAPKPATAKTQSPKTKVTKKSSEKQLTLDISVSKSKEEKKSSAKPKKPAAAKPKPLDKPDVDDTLSDENIIEAVTGEALTFIELGKKLKLSDKAEFARLNMKLKYLVLKNKLKIENDSGSNKYTKA